MVKWRAVPKDLSERLKVMFNEVAETLVSGTGPMDVQENFDIPWEVLNNHAAWVIEQLSGYIQNARDNGTPADRVLRTIFSQGFLAGIAFAVEEDHEPPHHN